MGAKDSTGKAEGYKTFVEECKDDSKIKTKRNQTFEEMYLGNQEYNEEEDDFIERTWGRRVSDGDF